MSVAFTEFLADAPLPALNGLPDIHMGVSHRLHLNAYGSAALGIAGKEVDTFHAWRCSPTA